MQRIYSFGLCAVLFAFMISESQVNGAAVAAASAFQPQEAIEFTDLAQESKPSQASMRNTVRELLLKLYLQYLSEKAAAAAENDDLTNDEVVVDDEFYRDTRGRQPNLRKFWKRGYKKNSKFWKR